MFSVGSRDEANAFGDCVPWVLQETTVATRVKAFNELRILMRRFLGVLVMLAIACAGLTAKSNETVTHSSGEAGIRIVEYVESQEAKGFSGVVLAARNRQVVAAVGVGPADLAGEFRITPATLFEIASATKQFTAAAVIWLVQEGRLGLDDSIVKHLPGVPNDCRSITVRHLLQHTSGIPGRNSRGGGRDLAKVLPSFLHGGPRHPPGRNWEYWNQGYALLSEIIDRVSGEKYVSFCKRALFEPSRMALTRFTGDTPPKGGVIAVGRSVYGKPRSALEHPYGNYGFQYRGMGGVVTTVWDLWRWDCALRGDVVLGRTAKSELFKPGLGDYALGWFVKTNKLGRRVQFHGGSVRGFASLIRRYPDDDGCLFVLSNRDDAPVGKVAAAVERILFSETQSSGKRP